MPHDVDDSRIGVVCQGVSIGPTSTWQDMAMVDESMVAGRENAAEFASAMAVAAGDANSERAASASETSRIL